MTILKKINRFLRKKKRAENKKFKENMKEKIQEFKNKIKKLKVKISTFKLKKKKSRKIKYLYISRNLYEEETNDTVFLDCGDLENERDALQKENKELKNKIYFKNN